jgi:putative membrane protein
MAGFGMIGIVLFWFAVVILAVWIVRGIFSSNRSNSSYTSTDPLTARQILEQRYARGEIDRAQFQIIMNDLLAHPEHKTQSPGLFHHP